MTINGHEVYLGDDGTMDTVIIVDGKEFRFSDVDRTDPDWFKDLAHMAIDELDMDASEEVI